MTERKFWTASWVSTPDKSVFTVASTTPDDTCVAIVYTPGSVGQIGFKGSTVLAGRSRNA